MINSLYFYIALVVIVLLASVIVRYRLRRKSDFIKGCATVVVIGVGALIWGLGNQITIVNDQDQAQEYTSFFSQDFTAQNGVKLTVPYQFSWRASAVINDGKKPLFYETVVYGSHTIPIKSMIINQYSVQNKLPAAIYYTFEQPPSEVTLRFVDSTERGWLHR